MGINNNAIGYRRLSERDQSRYSLEYQEQAIKDYCDRNDLNLVALYTDNGEHSDTFDRPDYRALESFIKKQKGAARYLIIMDHDRFSRNLPEALMKIDELEDKYRIKVLASTEDVNLDTKDPTVFIQRAFNYLMANQELLRIRKRTKDGIRQAQLLGRYVNMAPYGYINSRDESGRPLLKIDDEKAEIVRFVFKEYLSGTPVYLVYEEAKKKGFTKTGNDAMYDLLKNPLYAGMVRVNADRKNPEKLVKGLHQPIISETDYWLAQEKLSIKRKATSQPKEEFPLRGVLKCWCGCNMTAGFSKGKNKYYLYYRCIKHTETNIPGGMLHSQFEELLDTLSFTEKQVNYIVNKSVEAIKELEKGKKDVLPARKRQLAELDKKLDRLEEKLINDEIDSATYKKWMNRYSQDKAVITNEIEQAINNSEENKMTKLINLLPKLKSLKDVYRMVSPNRKKALVKAVFKLDIAYSDGKFRTPYIEPAFAHNALIAKEKGLLDIEESFDKQDKILNCSP
ncbi:recombinase family protein [Sphingobacterium sp.]|uniref:recombinase family protein n=1 Tax=Sphingobacterium sp. TaxID=341027 RepID=UPI00289D190A|nr:recombinase family protein [Sphingobacterium sp.]